VIGDDNLPWLSELTANHYSCLEAGSASRGTGVEVTIQFARQNEGDAALVGCAPLTLLYHVPKSLIDSRRCGWCRVSYGVCRRARLCRMIDKSS
jgi:hypothetical protein